MTRKILNPLESIKITVLSTSRDIIQDKDMAWLYLIMSPNIYENNEVFNEYLDKFNWHEEKERLIVLNKNFQFLLTKYHSYFKVMI